MQRDKNGANATHSAKLHMQIYKRLNSKNNKNENTIHVTIISWKRSESM